MAEQDEKYFTLDIPQREGRDGYIGTIFSLYLRLGGVIADGNFRDSDIRVYYMTKFLISLIPGEKNRKAIRDDLKKEIDEALKSITNNDEKGRKRNEICLDYIGKVHDFMDKHVGVSTENKIGFCVRPQQ